MNAGHLLIFAFIPSLLADPRLPARLSDLHIYSDLASGQVSTNYEPYSVNVSFWSDGADKERWFRLPPDTKIKYHPNGPWEFPPGTMFVKEFQKPTNGASHRIETRVLYLDAPSQITGATYRWNPDQSDAQLVESTQVLTDDSNPTKGKGWFLPGPQDCRVCHTPVNGGVLGLNTRQLNLTLTDGSNQLVSLAQYMDVVPRDIASCSKLPRIDDRFKDLAERVRSYLDVNCAFCHQPGGVAGNFDGRYDTPLEKQMLVEGPVLIDLNIDGARVISSRDPDRSILLSRLSATDGLKMPPLGHLMIDVDGVRLLREWIMSLPGETVVSPPAIMADPVSVNLYKLELKHPDSAVEIHFTTDGSAPNKRSPVYQIPIEVAAPSVIRSRAYKEGYKKSVTVQKVLTKQ